MGVRNCDRNSCESIMCDTYIPKVGYVCLDCQNEFKAYLNKIGADPTTEYAIKCDLLDFMRTGKGSYDHTKKITVDEYLSNYTN